LNPSTKKERRKRERERESERERREGGRKGGRERKERREDSELRRLRPEAVRSLVRYYTYERKIMGFREVGGFQRYVDIDSSRVSGLGQ
jgi:hypothetical protein